LASTIAELLSGPYSKTAISESMPRAHTVIRSALAAIARITLGHHIPEERDGGIVVPYESDWEGLPDAVERIITSGGASREQAQADLCHAISDGQIRLRCQLDKHADRPQTSTSVVSASQFEIPTKLEPGDFDWQESRPIAPWPLREFDRHQPGRWCLKWIKLSRVDVTTILLQRSDAAPPNVGSEPIGPPRKLERQKSSRVIAESAIHELWPEGPPPREKVSNVDLVARVSKQMKQTGVTNVSPDTILRAAGRRK
jgi:hypothetical protein